MGYPIEYPPPDPDGRPHIWLDFNIGKPLELDLGRLGGSAGSVRSQQLELGEGLGVVLFEDDGDEWMLVDATVDRFNPEGHYGGTWIVRVDWSTFSPPGEARSLGATPDPSPSATRTRPPAPPCPPPGQSGAQRIHGSSGSPELADPVGAVEVGEAQDVDELGASRRR
jgi:hypothetical protein